MDCRLLLLHHFTPDNWLGVCSSDYAFHCHFLSKLNRSIDWQGIWKSSLVSKRTIAAGPVSFQFQSWLISFGGLSPTAVEFYGSTLAVCDLRDDPKAWAGSNLTRSHCFSPPWSSMVSHLQLLTIDANDQWLRLFSVKMDPLAAWWLAHWLTVGETTLAPCAQNNTRLNNTCNAF